MASDLNKLGVDGRGGDIWKIDPRKVRIITDPAHPLYDRRALLPADEDLAANIIAVGRVLEPCAVRRNGMDENGSYILEIVYGRRRTKALIRANEILAEAGKDPILLPIELYRGKDDHAALCMASENQHRRQDDEVTVAERLAQMKARGASEEMIRVAFPTLKTNADRERALRLLDLAPEVQDAVVAGKIASVAAVRLDRLPREKQVEALAKMVTDGAVEGRAGVKKAREQTGEEKQGKSRSRKTLERAKEILGGLDGSDAKIWLDAITWAMGDDDAAACYGPIREALSTKKGKAEKEAAELGSRSKPACAPTAHAGTCGVCHALIWSVP